MPSQLTEKGLFSHQELHVHTVRKLNWQQKLSPVIYISTIVYTGKVVSGGFIDVLSILRKYEVNENINILITSKLAHD